MSHKTLYLALLALAVGLALLVSQLGGRSRESGPELQRAVLTPAAEVAAAEPQPEDPRTDRPSGAANAIERSQLVDDAPATNLLAAEEGFDPHALYGTVVDEAARGVPGARVLIFDRETSLFEQVDFLAETTTDAEGHFRVRDLEICRSYYALATVEGYRPALSRLATGTDHELRVTKGMTIHGRVLREQTDEPVPNVKVYAEVWHWDEDSMERYVETTTDADGHYSLPWARLDRFHKVTALEADKAPYSSEFQVDPDQAEGYDILLAGGKPLTFELFDPLSGEILPGLEVSILGARFTSDNEGRIGYDRNSKSEDLRYVTVHAKGHCRTTVYRDVLSKQELVRIPITRGGKAFGRVVDEDGKPVAGARVHIGGGPRNVRPPGMERYASLRNEERQHYSGKDGRFEVTGIAPTEEVMYIRADHREYARSDNQDLHLRDYGAQLEFELVVGEPAEIEGTVRIDGEPGPAEIRWSSEDSAGNGSGGGRSNDEGYYRLQGLPAGEITLTVRMDGLSRFSSQKAPKEVLTVIAGEVTKHDFDIHTDRVPIAGRVVDTNGNPVGGAGVYASCEIEGKRHSARDKTDAEGNFSMQVAGNAGFFYDVLAYEGHRRVRLEDVSPNTESLELVLPDLGLLRMRVVDAFTNEPIAGARLYYREHPEQPLTMLYQGGSQFQPGPDGSFLAKLPLGTFEVVVTKGDKNYIRGRIERVRITLEEVAEAEVALEKGVHAILQFEGEAEALKLFKKEFRKARMSLFNQEQRLEQKRGGPYFGREVRNHQNVSRRGELRGEVHGLAPGTYGIHNAPRNARLRPASFEIEPRDRQVITIRVETGKKKGNKGGSKR